MTQKKPCHEPNVRSVKELNATVANNDQKTAIIDSSKFPKARPAYSGSGAVKLTAYAPNRLEYSANMAGESLAVFSEIYYPEGWVATIDGREVDIMRANFVLRALEIPDGQHTIVFEFKPKVYSYGNLVTTISSVLVLLLFLGALAVESGLIANPMIRKS